MQCLVRSKEVSSHGHADLKASLLSWQVWVLGIAYCATVFGLTGLVFWMPQIIKQFKFTDTTVGLLSTIPYIIGAVIMVHGDDQGLILPPKLAPYQAVIVPIFKTDDEKSVVLDTAKKLKTELAKAQIRVTLDEREGQSPGWKFNDWEMRGVPLRVELGPKDVAKQGAVLARRDRPGKEGKISVSLADLPATAERLLADIQESLYNKALAFRTSHTHDAKTYEDLKKAVEEGFAFSFWCGSADCEAKIKEETRATMRCIPLEQAGDSGACVFCSQPAAERAIFGRAY